MGLFDIFRVSKETPEGGDDKERDYGEPLYIQPKIEELSSDLKEKCLSILSLHFDQSTKVQDAGGRLLEVDEQLDEDFEILLPILEVRDSVDSKIINLMQQRFRAKFNVPNGEAIDEKFQEITASKKKNKY